MPASSLSSVMSGEKSHARRRCDERGRNMGFLALGAFVAMFVVFVVLPKRLIQREEED